MLSHTHTKVQAQAAEGSFSFCGKPSAHGSLLPSSPPPSSSHAFSLLAGVSPTLAGTSFWGKLGVASGWPGSPSSPCFRFPEDRPQPSESAISQHHLLPVLASAIVPFQCLMSPELSSYHSWSSLPEVPPGASNTSRHSQESKQQGLWAAPICPPPLSRKGPRSLLPSVT